VLAEKPKVEELQMDWLRSEDLKEEKNVTAPMVIIAVEVLLHSALPSDVHGAVNECYRDFSPTMASSLFDSGFESLVRIPIWIGCCVNFDREHWHSCKCVIQSRCEFSFRFHVIRPFT